MKKSIVPMSLIAFFFSFTCVIPVIVPSFFSYVLSNNSYFNQNSSLSKSRTLIAMLLGVLLFTVIFELKGWPLSQTLTVCSLNLFFTTIFFFVGVYKRARDNKRIKKGWAGLSNSLNPS